MAAAKQRTLRIPDSVWELLVDAAYERGMGVTELMVESALDAVDAPGAGMHQAVEAARLEFRRRGLKVRKEQ